MPDAAPARAPEVRRLTDADRDRRASLYAGCLELQERPVDPDAIARVWSRLRTDTEIHALGAAVDGRLAGLVRFLVTRM